jgi:inner membrane transporter RhtA
MAVAAVVMIPPGLASAGGRLDDPGVWAVGAAVAVLSSVIPYSFELEALRSLSPTVFGVLMSLEPAVAALAGFLVLDQSLSALEGLAIALVVAASIGVTLTARGIPPPAEVPVAPGGPTGS